MEIRPAFFNFSPARQGRGKTNNPKRYAGGKKYGKGGRANNRWGVFLFLREKDLCLDLIAIFIREGMVCRRKRFWSNKPKNRGREGVGMRYPIRKRFLIHPLFSHLIELRNKVVTRRLPFPFLPLGTLWWGRRKKKKKGKRRVFLSFPFFPLFRLLGKMNIHYPFISFSSPPSPFLGKAHM